MDVTCPHCHQSFVIAGRAEQRGERKVRCPGCGQPARIWLGEGDDPEARERRATVLEGPGDRDEVTRSAQYVTDESVSPAEITASADEAVEAADAEVHAEEIASPDEPAARSEQPPPPSIRVRSDLGAQTGRRALETRRELSAYVPTEHDTDVAPMPAGPRRESSLPWLGLGIGVVVVALLVGVGAWLALRVEAGLEPEHQLAHKTESAADPESVAEPEPVAEAEAVAEPEAVAESEVVAESEAAAESEAVAKPEVVAESEAAAEPEPEAAAVPEPEVAKSNAPKLRPATHEVSGTAADRDAPYLALRDAPDSQSRMVAEMPDGTGLRVVGRRGRWLRVEIVDGPLAGHVGWAHRKWISRR